MAAALGAIPAVAQLAGAEVAEKLLAFADLHSLGFPQREDADRRSAITPALVAVTVTHVERLTGRFDFHRPAVTSACMRLRHDQDILSANQEPRKGISEIEGKAVRAATEFQRGTQEALFLYSQGRLIFARRLGSGRSLV